MLSISTVARAYARHNTASRAWPRQVERLVDLDVQIAHQQHALEEAEEDADNSIFEVDLPDASAEELAKMRQNAEKLDEMMVLLFEFINLTCAQRLVPLDLQNGGSIALWETLPPALSQTVPASPGDQTPSEVLFEALSSAFRASIMQTYKCR